MKIKLSNFEIRNIDYRKLKPLQGNLKILSEENYAKLKKSLTEKGLFVPLMVWRNGRDQFLMDGHGRGRLFDHEEVSFVDAKGKKTFDVPCLIISADNLKDAKEKLLLINSQYQTITQEGFDEFTFDLDDEWMKDTLNFDGLKFTDFEEEEAAEKKEEKSESGGVKSNECPKCGHVF